MIQGLSRTSSFLGAQWRRLARQSQLGTGRITNEITDEIIRLDYYRDRRRSQVWHVGNQKLVWERCSRPQQSLHGGHSLAQRCCKASVFLIPIPASSHSSEAFESDIYKMVSPQRLFILVASWAAFSLVEGSPTQKSVACSETNLVQNPSFEGTRFPPWINYHGSIASSNRDVAAKDLGKYL